MIPGLEPIPLRELQALGVAKEWTVEGSLDDLPSLTPVRGHLQAEHRGNVLEVEGSLETIVTLCCDRCLGQFNHRLSAEVKELIWLGAEPSADAMTEAGLDMDAPDGLVESLDPRSHFEPERWVFEQLSLQLPLVNRCGAECPGMPGATTNTRSTDPSSTDASSEALGQGAIDPRWQALKQLAGGDDDAS
ncbi:MAG: hypothetical protein RLZZ216_947 [Cyanobacteriota bacterium]|jgi:uncharacterized protein